MHPLCADGKRNDTSNASFYVSMHIAWSSVADKHCHEYLLSLSWVVGFVEPAKVEKAQICLIALQYTAQVCCELI